MTESAANGAGAAQDVQVRFGGGDWSGEGYLERGRVPERVREMLVVDFDYHIHDVPNAIAPFMEMPWRKSVEGLGTGPFEYLTIPAWSPSAFPWPYVPDEKGRRQIITTPEQAEADRLDLGIDYAVLFPDNLLSIGALKNDDYVVAVARGYNRWLAEHWLGHGQALKGALMVAPHDPAEAAAEIRRYADNPDIVCIFLPSAAVEPFWGDPMYEPVFDAAQETGLPLCFHAVAATIHPTFPLNVQGFQSLFGAFSFGHTLGMITHLVSLMETGVFVRYPDLRFVFTEAGISWLPFISLKMDRVWSEMRQQIPMLTELPSTYVKDACYVATQPIEEPPRMHDMAGFVEQIGAERIVFASDWPHHDFDHPAKILQIPVGDEAHRRIMGLNAAELLGLEVPAQRP